MVRKEYEVIEALSKEFPVKTLCEMCGVSRSGFYKWRARDGAPPENRRRIFELVRKCHGEHPSHGYRWVHAYLKRNSDIDVSADYIRRVFRCLGIHAETKRRPGSKQQNGRECAYPNLIFSTWDTVDRPRQVIVSDMTAFWTRWRYWELVFYFDVFTKQIIGHGITERRGFNGIYYEGLEGAIESIEQAKADAVGKLEHGCGEITVIHSDQGSVYTSKAYNEVIREKSIVRSCSRPGKPTDNPMNESLNGWIKEEMFLDFGLRDAEGSEVRRLVADYIEWYNAERPCWAIGYKTPNEFYTEFMEGRTERADTFKNRVLDPTPKFVREKLAAAEESARNRVIGTSDPAAA